MPFNSIFSHPPSFRSTSRLATVSKSILHQAQSKSVLTIVLLTFALTGCQHIAQSPKFQPPQVGAEQDAGKNQFALQGKIGIKTPQQSGSAFYSWQQSQEHFIIQLNGILGMGKTVIQGEPGNVSLDSAKTGLIQAASPEALLEQATGWHAPITYLVDWVQARPATTKAHTQLDRDQRISHIEEEGWSIDLSYAEQQRLPNKLIMTQLLEEDQQNRITLLIQNRE